MGATVFTRDCETRLGISKIETEKHRVLQGYVDTNYAKDLDQQ